MQRETREPGRGACRDAEKIDEYALGQPGVVVRQNSNRAVGSQNFQYGARRLIFVDGLISTQAPVFRDERVHARVVYRPDQKMQRIAEKRLRERSQFPRAHMPREKQNSLPMLLRRREILESVEEHRALDIVFRVARKTGEFRRHPAQLPDHPANDGSALSLAPFRKRQLQVFQSGPPQARPHPEQNRRHASAHESCHRTRHRADHLEQQPHRSVFQPFSHPGIIVGQASACLLFHGESFS